MNRLFKIQTLSECKTNLRDYTRLADPASVILGISTVLPSLFPNLFGSELNTRAAMDKLFPGNGYWTAKYKNYLLSKIKYIKDIERDLHQYTGEFIEQNLNQIAPQGCQGTGCWQAFYKLLQQESVTGGVQPVGNVFGSTFDPMTLLLVGGGVVLLLALTKKKRSKK